jgi:hypothetical protein
VTAAGLFSSRQPHEHDRSIKTISPIDFGFVKPRHVGV